MLKQTPAQSSTRFNRLDILPLLCLLTLIALFYWTAPRDGSFWWSDAPRHALNGVFVRDLIRDHPLRNPQAYAMDYYVRYPALTILFYPPLFYVISALFFSLFGVSHAVALIPELLSYFCLALGAYVLSRRWLDRPGSLGVALTLSGAPEVALWGRQVMLEIPSFAFLIWSVCFLFRYLDTGNWKSFTRGMALFVCALYVKLSVLFMAPVIVLGLVAYRGKAVLRERHLYWTILLSVLAVIPLVVLTVKFGQTNLHSASGISDAVVPRNSIAGWTWYLRQLPKQLSWPVVFLAGAFGGSVIAVRRWRLPWKDSAFLCAWFGLGYIFFSSIDLKEARHSILILFPVVLWAVLFLYRIFEAPVARVAAMVLGISLAGTTLVWHPVPRVEGYAEAANFVADHAPRNSIVLFSGYRDGSFIFNLRTREDRKDLAVLRADKILLRIAVRRSLGVEEKLYSEEQIAELINQYGVHYVVAQTDFWTDLAPMARLQNVLHSGRFKPVARIPVHRNVPAEDNELVVYMNLGPVVDGPKRLRLDLPIIGRTVEGKVQ